MAIEACQFWSTVQKFFASFHQWVFISRSSLVGVSVGGNVINMPIAGRYTGKDFLATLESCILPAKRKFGPEFLI